NRPNDTIVMEGTRAAFKDAAKTILADPNFVAAVTDRRGAPVASQVAPAAPTTVQVAHLPLSKVPFRQQVNDLRKQVITIVTPSGGGSGFYIADGLVLTNEHVIGGFKDVKVKFMGGREVAGQVIASDARRDVALVQTEHVGVPGLPLRTEQPEIASPTFVIGSPLDPKYEGSVISGIVSGFRDHRYGPMIQSDVNVTHGNSGGPMFDEHGNVIGLVDIGIPGQDGQATAINLFIPIADALAKLNIQANLALGAAPMLASAPAQGFAPQATQQAALSAPATREIKVMMFPAAGPVKDSGHSGALAGVAAGVGTSGTFTFARPDNVSCNGRWTTLQTKPQSGSLVDKHKQVTGLPAEVTGMVGGLAIGSCSNAASFQAEYYAVPGADSGFGAAEDSDGNIYKIIF
ncbi:MAG: serine protease, partial [Rhodospirillaceae bacterium]|nr:serine protease [Rhodospirillaceae bacterium]